MGERKVAAIALATGDEGSRSETRVAVAGVARSTFAEGAHAARDDNAYGALLGGSAKMQQLFQQLHRLERSLLTVLVSGPSGSGKELVARELHERSRARHGPFVAVNCGALDRTLARSELFGHRRGAFTGAVDAQAGAFDLAAGGTLFLDEIGELPLDAQPILLRVLERAVFSPVGDGRERAATARIVTATNRNLLAEVRAGRFREDLYYRLSVIKLEVPALTDADDIELLAHHFAADEEVALPAEMVDVWRAQPWPGNARELRNAVRAFAALGVVPSRSVEPHHTPSLDAALRAHVDLGTSYADQKRIVEQTFLSAYLEQLLQTTRGNQSEAARISGLTRGYISRILKDRRR